MNSITYFAQARANYEMARSDWATLGEDYDNAEADLLADIQYQAKRELMLTPAPDWQGLAYKMEVFATEDCFNMSKQYRDPLFEALISDVRWLGRQSR